MNSIIKTKMGKALTSTFMMLAMLGVSQSAFATLAADHVIRNSVSVDYSDSANAPQSTITATVDITVSLVSAAVSVTPSWLTHLALTDRQVDCQFQVAAER